MTKTNSSSLDTSPNSKSQVGLLTTCRLGLFNLALGLMAVLTLAVLNRVMISELGIPATITAFTLALSQFIAPARVWFGQISDNKPLLGRYRTNYIRIGAIVFSLAVFIAVQIVWQLGAVVRANGEWLWNTQTIGWTALLALVMVIYGLGVSFSSTPFTALLVDISAESNRSKLVAIVWSMLMIGIAIGGISGGIVLQQIDTVGIAAGEIPLATLQAPINSVFASVPFLVISFAFIATWGVEKKYSRFQKRSRSTDREDSMTLGKSLKILTASRQTTIFFSFLCLLTLSLFMQEAVLEPYGGEVFGMSIAETTKLNANWALGILIGYGITGFSIVPRLGKKSTTKLGCLLAAISFLLIVLAGFTREATILKSAIVLFGVTAGIATVGGISLMLDFTAAETAGTFIGAWGLAQAMSRAFATVIGGAILDLGKMLLTTPILAYGLVFMTQAITMVVAVAILNRINVREFKNTTRKAIATVMEGDLD